jgi:hypothetical protein
LWRAPRIHGEVLKLAIEVLERTVSHFVYYHRSRTHLALPQDGYHPLLVQDSKGKLLDGGKKYAITFAKGQVPPLERSGP